jgi:hypothetical protein
MAKVNCQSILGSPRWRALRSPATVLAQPNALIAFGAQPIRFLIRWLTV